MTHLGLRTLSKCELPPASCARDVHDPATGAIRSSSTDDIACEFIDSDYDEESFFVRRSYFSGADELFKKRQRALTAEIEEAAWSTLYSTVSSSLDARSTARFVVKVVNHCGNEVPQVYSVDADRAP